MELDRIRAGLGDGGLRFKSSVQELRFEPSYRSGVKAREKSGGDGRMKLGGASFHFGGLSIYLYINIDIPKGR